MCLLNAGVVDSLAESARMERANRMVDRDTQQELRLELKQLIGTSSPEVVCCKQLS